MSKPKLSLKNYVGNGGSCCPYCESDQITGMGSLDFGRNRVYQNVVCDDCKMEWTDVYELVGYEEVDTFED